MDNELIDILEHPPVQVKCEAVNEDSSRKLYAYTSLATGKAVLTLRTA
jgi:hypothetical protein